MAKSCVWVICLFSLLLGHGVLELEASQHEYRNPQSMQSQSSKRQPYRTAYHFQPPQNWMNVFKPLIILLSSSCSSDLASYAG
ncbi:unnamed protein product [Ilex paraguariensis]|uniref:Uncharacterized protein n=1 Tax=Ilex paraguariensis TaxID=185542 RepID=A0ABC8UFZ9_9AQUA